MLFNEILWAFNTHSKTSDCECDRILLASTYHACILQNDSTLLNWNNSRAIMVN